MSEQLTDEQLTEIKARAEAATLGPWRAESVDCCVISEALGDDDEGGCWVADFGCAFPDDGEFIAHAREDIPALLTEVERLRYAVKTLLGHIDGLRAARGERAKGE